MYCITTLYMVIIMNNTSKKRIIFRDVDRIIKIIYKEIKIQTHVNLFSSCKYQNKNFDLRDHKFRKLVNSKYLEIYTDNYHEDELNLILDDLTDLLLKKYNSSNSIYLIMYVSDIILKHDLKQMYVDFEDILEWDGFINKVDSNLFLASKLAMKNIAVKESYLESVALHNNHFLYDIFYRIGLSENHMHLQASGYVTDINWYSFLEKSIFDKEYFEKFIKTEGIYEGIPKTKSNINKLRNDILKIKILRMIIEKFDTDFKNLSKKTIDGLLKSEDVEIYCQSNKVCLNENIPNEQISLARVIMKEKKEFYQNGMIDKNKSLLKYREYEINFLKNIFTRIIKNNDNNVNYFIYLFNLYVCGMTDIKFQFIQDNLGMGFNKFKEKEDNKKWFIEGESSAYKDIVKSCFHKYYREKYIKNVELRIGPWESGEDYINLIEEINGINLDQWKIAKKDLNNPNLPRLNFGIIVHFIKFKRKDLMLQSFEDNDNKYRKTKENPIDYMRRRREDLEDETNAILNALYLIDRANRNSLDNRELKNKIVGIDTANYELDNRPNLYACTFRKLRYDNTVNQVLYATYHVGEEFPTLANGLRAIDEVVTFCAYRPNDRLGHALALGIDPHSYFKTKRNNVMCYLEDYIDDVVWMYRILNASSYAEDKQFLPFLKAEFESYKHLLFSEIFSMEEIPSFEDYFDAYILRGDCPNAHLDIQSEKNTINYDNLCHYYKYKLNYRDSEHKMAFINEKARSLYLRYSFDKKYREKAIEPIKVPVTEMYEKVVTRVQHLLKEKVLSLRIFIEANPTSNKKISYVKRYSNLPALKLNSYPLENCEEKIHLPISINTDDSSIFQTNLTNEYSMVAAALIRDGYPEQKVYAYLEQLAIASNVHSFVDKNNK